MQDATRTFLIPLPKLSSSNINFSKIRYLKKQLNKYFAPYIRQNIDNGTRIDILGYSVNQRSVYATIKLKIDFINSDDNTVKQFSAKETANIIKMYIEIFRTFAEQYQNIV